MAEVDERVVQASMFDLLKAPERPPEGRERVFVRRGGNRVTRDPEVAIAHEEAYRYAHSVKLGLARILASRSDDERTALRMLLERGRVA